MMDEYLITDASYKRLLQEYRKYGSLVIGFDFDNTVHDYHKTGATYTIIIQLLRDLKRLGCRLVCWTAHPNHDYVNNFLIENKIPFDGINTDGVKLGWESRKPMYSALLDDRAGLIQVYNELRKLSDVLLNEE